VWAAPVWLLTAGWRIGLGAVPGASGRVQCVSSGWTSGEAV